MTDFTNFSLVRLVGGRSVQANSVQQLPDLANPVDKRQHYRVVQVMGSIYKADYRMRLIYHHTAGICLLMGQEVLELSQP